MNCFNVIPSKNTYANLNTTRPKCHCFTKSNSMHIATDSFQFEIHSSYEKHTELYYLNKHLFCWTYKKNKSDIEEYLKGYNV